MMSYVLLFFLISFLFIEFDKILFNLLFILLQFSIFILNLEVFFLQFSMKFMIGCLKFMIGCFKFKVFKLVLLRLSILISDYDLNLLFHLFCEEWQNFREERFLTEQDCFFSFQLANLSSICSQFFQVPGCSI